MDAPIRLIDEERRAYNGPLLSPRSLAANTLASLPQPVNPAEVAAKVYCTPTLYDEEELKALVAKRVFCSDNWDPNLIIEKPSVDERVYQARPLDSDEPHFFICLTMFSRI